MEEAATVLARHVGDIDEAVEVAATAGAAGVSFARILFAFHQSFPFRFSFARCVSRTGRIQG